MCATCQLAKNRRLDIWERLIAHYGIVGDDPDAVYAAKWLEFRRGGLVHLVWSGSPDIYYFNLLCVSAEDPGPENGLITCDKIQELLDSPHGFDEALELYMYERAIRRM